MHVFNGFLDTLASDLQKEISKYAALPQLRPIIWITHSTKPHVLSLLRTDI